MKSIETKKVKTVNNKTLIVTVDISKRTNVGYCRCPDGTDIKPFKFNNNGQAFNYLWDRIIQMKNTYSMEEVVFGFEPTGPYGEPLIYFMKKRDVKLNQ